MAFNFDDLLAQGRDAANLVVQNKREVGEVFDNLRESLSRFLDVEVSFEEDFEYEDESRGALYRAALIFEERKKTGYNSVFIKNEETRVKRKLLSIKRSSDGYPVTIVDGKSHYIAENQEELAKALGTVAANSQTHLMFRHFKTEVDKELEKKVSKDSE